MNLGSWIWPFLWLSGPADFATGGEDGQWVFEQGSQVEFAREWFHLPCGETLIGCFGVQYDPSSDPIAHFTYMTEVSIGQLEADFTMNDFHVLTLKLKLPMTRHKKLLRPIREY